LHNIVFVVGEKSRVQVDRCDRIPHRCPARCLTVTLTRCQNSGDGVTAPLSTNHGLLSATSRPSRPCNRTVQVEKRTAFSNVANLQRLRRNLHLKSKTLSIQRFAAIYGGGVVGATRQKDRDFEQTHLQAPHLPTRPRHPRETNFVCDSTRKNGGPSNGVIAHLRFHHSENHGVDVCQCMAPQPVNHVIRIPERLSGPQSAVQVDEDS